MAYFNQLVECLALDKLHNNEVDTVVAGDIVDSDDVGMIECRGGLGFLDKSPFAIRVRHEFRRKYFDGNEPV
jgi:hypothetical protein